jgi:flavin reductase (DIM6/NTAB) family NADH-FMN oxidoreductase RutF
MKIECSIKPNRLFAPQLVGLVSSIDKNGSPMLPRLPREGDKFEKCGLTPVESIALRTTCVKECAAHIDCKVVDMKEAGDHTLFIGKVVATTCEIEAVRDGVLDVSRIKPVLRLGGTFFTTTGEIVDSKKL